jgi:hypothetical protein
MLKEALDFEQSNEKKTKKKLIMTKRTALFWVITQRVVIISYRRFGTTKSEVLSYFAA